MKQFLGGVKGYIELDNIGIDPKRKGFQDILPWLRNAEMGSLAIFVALYMKICNERIRDAGRTLFLAQQDFEFLEAFHLGPIKHPHDEGKLVLKQPVRFTSTILKVKNTSLMVLVEATDPNEMIKYMTLIQTFVLVDRVKRRPVPFPNAFKSFVNSFSIQNYSIAKEPVRTAPGANVSVFIWKKTVCLLDVDYNAHANNSVYPKAAWECIGHAIDKAYEINLPGEIDSCEIKKYSVIIAGESRLGQDINVKMWQSEDGLFHFIMSLGDKNIAYVTLALRC